MSYVFQFKQRIYVALDTEIECIETFFTLGQNELTRQNILHFQPVEFPKAGKGTQEEARVVHPV